MICVICVQVKWWRGSAVVRESTPGKLELSSQATPIRRRSNRAASSRACTLTTKRRARERHRTYKSNGEKSSTRNISVRPGLWRNAPGLVRYKCMTPVVAGSFVAGLKSGKGSYQYPNGDWYKGEWFQGKKHGQGTYFVKQGNCYFIGQWSEGSFVAGDWKLKDGSFYRGHFVDGRPAAGPAVYTFRNGNVQYGEWIAKKRELAEGEEEEEVPEGQGLLPTNCEPVHALRVRRSCRLIPSGCDCVQHLSQNLP